ncbi:MAG TPA: hypothetical protein VFQ38_04115 [Longimicrobiales bacterium]|nr:hypothetical protein [Longimicrobiales bacterium]
MQLQQLPESLLTIGIIVFVVLVVVPFIATRFLRDVEKGQIRIVSWLGGRPAIYRGPGKSKEIPLLTTGATIPSSAINVDLDITDQTADRDAHGNPQPIKVQVLASAIVSVGDTDDMILTAANRFFSKSESEQTSTLIDLMSSSGRRAINLLTHNQLFSAAEAPKVAEAADDEEDPLAVIIKKACSRELTDLGLTFNSLNIKSVQSEVAEALRRQSAAVAKAEAEIVAAVQARRAKEAQLEAERAISDKERELASTRAANAALVAQAEAQKQDALAVQRQAELRATQIAQASADAERVKIEATASAEAEAIRIARIADAQAEAIRKVNEAIRLGGEAYFRYRQIEMLPDIAPVVADALGRARLVTISGDGKGAASGTADQIGQVLNAVLAMQVVGQSGLVNGTPAIEATPAPPAPEPPPAPPRRGIVPPAR